MEKITRGVFYQNDEYSPYKKAGKITAYVGVGDNRNCLLVDENDNILFVVTAECVQNFGVVEFRIPGE